MANISLQALATKSDIQDINTLLKDAELHAIIHEI